MNYVWMLYVVLAVVEGTRLASVQTQRELVEDPLVSTIVDDGEARSKWLDAAVAILPRYDELRHWLREEPRSCALVGNSGILTGVKLGEEIDAHDVVLRFNLAPVDRRFRRDVGSKCSIMLLNWRNGRYIRKHECEFAQNYTDMRYVWLNAHRLTDPPLRDQQHDFSDYVVPTAHSAAKCKPPIRVSPMSPHWKAMAARILRSHPPVSPTDAMSKAKPSSGFKAFLLLYTSCDSVDVYGFGISNATGNGHYYDELRPNDVDEEERFLGRPAHTFGRERHIMEQAAKKEWKIGTHFATVTIKQRGEVETLTQLSVEQVDQMENSNEEEETIHIAMMADESEWLGLFACMHSIFLTHKPSSIQIHLFLLPNELDAFEKQLNCLIRPPFRRSVRLHSVPPSQLARLHIPDAGKTSLYRNLTDVHNYIRFLLPDLLPNLSKLLYLDADTLVLSSLFPLFNEHLNEEIGLGGVTVMKKRWREQINVALAASFDPAIQKCASSPCPYMNAGVLLMRLDLWRRRRIFDLCVDVWMRRKLAHPDLYSGGSQPVLLLCFLDKTEKLDLEWNFSSERRINMLLDGREGLNKSDLWMPLQNAKIVHFNGPHKPWIVPKTEKERKMYRSPLLWRPFALGADCSKKERTQCRCHSTFPKQWE